MLEQPANLSGYHEQNANLLRWIGLVSPALVALVAALLFTVNDTDTLVIRNGSLQILMNDEPYELVEGNKSPFTSPPHVALIGLPFVIAGSRWSAFWNVFFSLPLVIGNKNQLLTLAAKLSLIFTPPFLYMLASANITGTVTGIGLLLLFAEVKGPARGIAWAFLLLRPQDSWTFLIYDGVKAARNRDYTAAVTTLVIVLLPLLFTPTVIERWLQAMYYPLFVDTLPGYTLSLAGTHGLVTAVAFLAIVAALRAFTFKPGMGLTRRQLADVSQAEVYWYLAVVALVAGPYTAYYMLWLAFLIVRDYGFVRTLLLLLFTMSVGVVLMTAPNPEQVQIAMLLLIMAIAVISPRTRSESEAAIHNQQPAQNQNGSSSMSPSSKWGFRRRTRRLL